MSQLQPQSLQRQQQHNLNNDHNSQYHPHLITHQHPRLQGDKYNGWHDGRDWKKAQDMSLDVSWAIGMCFFKFTILFTVNGYFYWHTTYNIQQTTNDVWNPQHVKGSATTRRTMCDDSDECNDEVCKGSGGRDREKAQDMSNDVSWAVGASFFKNYCFFYFN